MAAQGAEHVKMQDKGIAFCADRYNHVNDAVVLYQVIVLKREHVFSVGKTSDRRQRGCFLLEAAPKRIRQDGKKRTKRPGDAFHVLHGGGEEGLLVHVADSEHAGIAQAMQLFGFCEGSFNGFLAPGVDTFPAACLPKRVRLFQCILPYICLLYTSRCV